MLQPDAENRLDCLTIDMQRGSKGKGSIHAGAAARHGLARAAACVLIQAAYRSIQP